MAKLQAARVAGYLQKPDPGHRAFLIYGPDPTLVTERRDALVLRLLGATDDPFRLARLAADSLKRDAALLSDELNAVAFGGGGRVVVVDRATDALAKAAGEALEAMPTDAALIITADALAASSKLRKLIEGHGAAVALPCYPAEGAALESEFVRWLEGLGAPPPDREARRALGGVLTGLQHGEAQRFAETLALHATGEAAIDAEAVLACAPPAAETDFDTAIQAVAQGRARALPELIDRLDAQGASLAGLIRVLSLYFQRLHRAQALMQSEGLDAGGAMGRLRPPVFFKLRDTFAAQLRAWPRPGVEAALVQLGALEAQLRSGRPHPERALIERVLMRVAMSAPGARSRG